MTLGIIYGIAASALWGLSFIIPLVLGYVSAEFLAFGRFGFYALFSIGFLIPHYRKVPQAIKGNRLLWLIFLSAVGNSLFYILMVEAVRRAGIPATSIITGSLPVTIAVFGARSFLELKKFIPSLILISLGLLIVQWPNLKLLYSGGTVPWDGVLLAAASHLCWLMFALFNASFLKNNPDISGKMWSELMGVVTFVTLAIFLMLKLPFTGIEIYQKSISLEFILLSLTLGFGGSFLGNWFWNETSRLLSTSFAGQLIVFETVFALIYESLYKKTPPYPFEIVALLFLILAVVLATRSQAR